jgi:tRNA uridine 5-carboxymethylaminomethyl modification enzyme
MFTSRAEHRLVLREDNADLRLTEKGFLLGLVSAGDFARFNVKKAEIERSLAGLRGFYLYPEEKTQSWMEKKGLRPLKDRVSGEIFLRRPEVGLRDLMELGFEGPADPQVAEQVEIQVKYQGYIDRELASIEGIRSNEDLRLPIGLVFEEIGGLSAEVLGRLKATRPETLGQLSRMPGITPAAVANVLIHLQMRKKHA